jgi:hypothetical protein
MTEEQRKTTPGRLQKNDQTSGLVAALYRLSNMKPIAASPAHNAKNIIVALFFRTEQQLLKGKPGFPS